MKNRCINVLILILSSFLLKAQSDSLKIRKELEKPQKQWMIGGAISGSYLHLVDPPPNQIKNTWEIAVKPRIGYFFNSHLLLWTEFSFAQNHTRLGVHNTKDIGLSLRYYPKNMILVFPIKLRIKQHYFAIRTYGELGYFLSNETLGDSFQRPFLVTNRLEFGSYNAAFGINLRLKKNLFLQFAYNYIYMPESLSKKYQIYGTNGIEWQF
jgi:hypothetical protein